MFNFTGNAPFYLCVDVMLKLWQSVKKLLRQICNIVFVPSRFRCLLTTMQPEPARVECIVLACCTLHNLLRTRYIAQHQQVDKEDPDTHDVTPGAWREDEPLLGLQKMVGTSQPKMPKPKGITWKNTTTLQLEEFLGKIPWFKVYLMVFIILHHFVSYYTISYNITPFCIYIERKTQTHDTLFTVVLPALYWLIYFPMTKWHSSWYIGKQL